MFRILYKEYSQNGQAQTEFSELANNGDLTPEKFLHGAGIGPKLYY